MLIIYNASHDKNMMDKTWLSIGKKKRKKTMDKTWILHKHLVWLEHFSY